MLSLDPRCFLMDKNELSKEEVLEARKEAKKEARKGRWKRLATDFRKFIAKGNVLDMAVGVIMGSAFNAIVTSFTAILLSICTWGVPGGLSGLVTVLPAVTDAQRVPSDILVDGNALQQVYTASEWANLSQADGFTATISGMYTKHGGSYYYNGSAIIDWGAFINAIISFLIIALTLFVIVKVFATLKARRIALQEELRKAKEKKEGIEKKAEEETPALAPKKADDILLLEEIRDEIRKLNKPAPEEPSKE